MSDTIYIDVRRDKLVEWNAARSGTQASDNSDKAVDAILSEYLRDLGEDRVRVEAITHGEEMKLELSGQLEEVITVARRIAEYFSVVS
jgi:hypothetical protein